ncbi:carbonic anhydrase family protein [Paraflavitalea sp. CAU 1676]|uniref:carbonic anhydrase family protein n=1 Tax=Paraflavitalea sp. CAU 1676 TaxID=3032598 RepID=UPI0023DBAFE6|nr:carbonic anhydrase family protein [Paraflavitalea sp. CAU 1676]MDF2187687.1 carbonic anhydrase family protein [Paraflavitalea sp. CAU 1676]
MRTHNKETQATTTPEMALDFLKEGNRRFVSNLKYNRDLLQQVNETKEGQWPFAVILSCIDSRTSAELVFDQGLGDVFSVRIAGNVVNDDIVGSMEFACKVAGSKLIVVLGHSKCGAIKGACSHVELGHLTGLLNKVKPAIEKVEEERGQQATGAEFVEAVAHANTLISLEEILERSPILREMYENGEIGLAAAYYQVETGEVKFIKEKVKAGELVA